MSFNTKRTASYEAVLVFIVHIIKLLKLLFDLRLVYAVRGTEFVKRRGIVTKLRINKA